MPKKQPKMLFPNTINSKVSSHKIFEIMFIVHYEHPRLQLSTKETFHVTAFGNMNLCLPKHTHTHTDTHTTIHPSQKNGKGNALHQLFTFFYLHIRTSFTTKIFIENLFYSFNGRIAYKERKKPQHQHTVSTETSGNKKPETQNL